MRYKFHKYFDFKFKQDSSKSLLLNDMMINHLLANHVPYWVIYLTNIDCYKAERIEGKVINVCHVT